MECAARNTIHGVLSVLEFSEAIRFLSALQESVIAPTLVQLAVRVSSSSDCRCNCKVNDYVEAYQYLLDGQKDGYYLILLSKTLLTKQKSLPKSELVLHKRSFKSLLPIFDVSESCTPCSEMMVCRR